MSYTEQYFRIQIIVLYIALVVFAISLIGWLVVHIYKKVIERSIEKQVEEWKEIEEIIGHE